METETANSREKKQDIGRKKEIWRYVVTKRTRNTQHTQTGRQTGRQAGAVEPAGRKANKISMSWQPYTKEILQHFTKGCGQSCFHPATPTPQFQCWGVVSFFSPIRLPFFSTLKLGERGISSIFCCFGNVAVFGPPCFDIYGLMA